MILFLLLHKWEGRKLKALFYLGLTNLCNVRFVGKNIYMTASTLLLASDTVPKSLNTLSRLIHITNMWGMYSYPLSTCKEAEGKPFEFSDKEKNV